MNKGTSRQEKEQCVPIEMPNMLKNTSTKHNKYVVNKKFKNFDDISCKELSGIFTK